MGNSSLSGKVALVTGAGRGIGRAIATRLAQRGADVVMHDLDRESPSHFGESSSLDEVCEFLRGFGSDAMGVTGDLTNAAVADQMVTDVLAAKQKIDILVNNAGGDIAADGRGKADPNDMFIPEADMLAILHRNLLSTMHVSRPVGQHLCERGEGGRIVNIASLAGLAATTFETAYAVAKAGVIHYTRCAAVRLRPFGVTVNALAPGRIKTARWMATISSRHGAEDELDEARPLLRLGEPEDVANVVEFFVSDLASFVSGEVLRVDGGLQTTTAAGHG